MGHIWGRWKKKRRQLGGASMAQWHEKWKARTVHPKLRIGYFHKIDSKEKAYWLGFLYADGVLRTSTSGTIYIRLELSRTDEDVIDRFCECLRLEKSKKEYRKHEQTESVEIRFACKQMVNDLFPHGLKFGKSNTIEFPRIPSRNMELAFLLGYFDGDGKQNSAEIASGSIRFLQQIKDKFKLRYRIQFERRQKEIYGRKIEKGTEYRLWLGVKLFDEMLTNYPKSMGRKRGYRMNVSGSPIWKAGLHRKNPSPIDSHLFPDLLRYSSVQTGSTRLWTPLFHLAQYVYCAIPNRHFCESITCKYGDISICPRE